MRVIEAHYQKVLSFVIVNLLLKYWNSEVLIVYILSWVQVLILYIPSWVPEGLHNQGSDDLRHSVCYPFQQCDRHP